MLLIKFKNGNTVSMDFDAIHGSVLYLDNLAFSGSNVSINEFLAKIGFKLYPNPVEDVLFVKSETSLNNALILLMLM
ncbi:MAG: hypothetical protein ACK4K0_09130 [Flavobacteriales bacterium]